MPPRGPCTHEVNLRGIEKCPGRRVLARLPGVSEKAVAYPAYPFERVCRQAFEQFENINQRKRWCQGGEVLPPGHATGPWPASAVRASALMRWRRRFERGGSTGDVGVIGVVGSGLDTRAVALVPQMTDPAVVAPAKPAAVAAWPCTAPTWLVDTSTSA